LKDWAGGADPGTEVRPEGGAEIVRVVPLVRVRALADRVFDYRVPPGLPRPAPGTLVTVPFAGRLARGLVVEGGASGEVTAERLRELEAIGETAVSADLLRLADHLSERYLSPLGACVRAVLPPHLTGTVARSEPSLLWVTPLVGAHPPETNLTPRQAAVLGLIPPHGGPLAEVQKTAGTSRSVLDALAGKGLVSIERRPVWAAAAEEAGERVALPELTPPQAEAVADLEAALARRSYQRRLLWGVTGSGKTEVYLRLLARVVADGRGAVVLVPEIALTLQTAARLSARLGADVALLHSALPAGRRAAEYERLARGEARVAVGARSAVFAPVRDLALVIVDEAHDSSYKQEDEPRYDAREVAAWRARESGALLVEGTATPRLESLIAEGSVLRLPRPAHGGVLPEVEVIDLRRQAGRRLLAPVSRAALQDALQRGEQAVVLLNRRGYAGFLHCEACGAVTMCPRCEVSLTYYHRERRLRCNHCGHSETVPLTCPTCRSAALSRGSPGTERLGEELEELLPAESVFRLDSDSVTSASRLDELLGRFAATSPAILVGTQMVAKGHDYPGVTLVVVAAADTGLYLPDFRATERTFHLLVQVAGRAGRGERQGRVLLQTWNPEVPCIRMAVGREEQRFYELELDSRRRLGYPPFRELVRVVLSANRAERAQAAAEHLAGRLHPHLGEAELLGPARLPTIRERARWHMLLSSADGERLRSLLRRAVGALREPYSRRGVDLLVDVDPQSFL
jgi:primosomal protein N' (replication factor Y) (superfamily II helicase)